MNKPDGEVLDDAASQAGGDESGDPRAARPVRARNGSSPRIAIGRWNLDTKICSSGSKRRRPQLARPWLPYPTLSRRERRRRVRLPRRTDRSRNPAGRELDDDRPRGQAEHRRRRDSLIGLLDRGVRRRLRPQVRRRRVPASVPRPRPDRFQGLLAQQPDPRVERHLHPPRPHLLRGPAHRACSSTRSRSSGASRESGTCSTATSTSTSTPGSRSSSAERSSPTATTGTTTSSSTSSRPSDRSFRSTSASRGRPGCWPTGGCSTIGSSTPSAASTATSSAWPTTTRPATPSRYLNFKPFAKSERFPLLRNLNLGVSGFLGQQVRPQKPLPLRTSLQSSENDEAAQQATSVFLVYNEDAYLLGGHSALAAHIAWYVGGLSFEAEWQGGRDHYAKAGPFHPVSVPVTGNHITASYFVTGEQVDGSQPRRPPPPLRPDPQRLGAGGVRAVRPLQRAEPRRNRLQRRPGRPRRLDPEHRPDRYRPQLVPDQLHQDLLRLAALDVRHAGPAQQRPPKQRQRPVLDSRPTLLLRRRG